MKVSLEPTDRGVGIFVGASTESAELYWAGSEYLRIFAHSHERLLLLREWAYVEGFDLVPTPGWTPAREDARYLDGHRAGD